VVHSNANDFVSAIIALTNDPANVYGLGDRTNEGNVKREPYKTRIWKI